MDSTGPKTIHDLNPKNFFASFIKTTKFVLFHPHKFFDGMQRDGGFRNPIIFLICCISVQTLMASILLGNAIIIPPKLAFGMVFPLLTAGVLFLIINRLFKAPGTYEMAFRVNAYAGAVSLFSWIPLIGMILEIYRLYLIGVGLSTTFSIKGLQAFLAIFLTFIVYIVVSGALVHLTGGKLPLGPGI